MGVQQAVDLRSNLGFNAGGKGAEQKAQLGGQFKLVGAYLQRALDARALKAHGILRIAAEVVAAQIELALGLGGPLAGNVAGLGQAKLVVAVDMNSRHKERECTARLAPATQSVYAVSERCCF